MWYAGTDTETMEFELAETLIVYPDVRQRIAEGPTHYTHDSIDVLLMWPDLWSDRC